MLLVAIMSAKAQDILTLTDNSVLKVKVLEITPTEIKYKKFDNINGPTYTSLISGVKSIIYENGTTETFNNPNPVQSEPAVSPILNSTSPQQDLSVSDRQLLIMDQYHGQDMNWQKYQKRGKIYKKIGIIGGSALIAACVTVFCVWWETDDAYALALGVPLGAAGLVSGTVFYTVGVNQCKKADRIKAASLMTTTLYNSGKSNLTAGIDLLGNQNNYSVGIGLRYSF